jgi:predicted nucleotidyltransferase
MRFGLEENDINIICSYLSKYPEIEKATIFGSRAKGNFKKGSDVDIALYGRKVTLDTVTSVNYEQKITLTNCGWLGFVYLHWTYVWNVYADSKRRS